MSPPSVQLTGARLGFGGPPVLDGFDLSLAPGERAALIGRNGAGKSTLMGVIAGAVALDGGTRFVQPGLRVGRLAQMPDLAGHTTLRDYVTAGLPADLADETHRADAMLDGVGLDGDRSAQALSGGEARRAALARALAGAPDVLLLDEPTNHLDLPTIEWLEEVVAKYRGAAIIVSHDRAFLSRVTNRVLWLDRGELRRRDTGFGGVEDWIAEVEAAEDAAIARRDKRIASETHWLREGLTARRKRNQGRVRALEALRRERREHRGRQGTAQLAATAAEAGGRRVISAEAIGVSVGDGPDRRSLFGGFSSRIMRGDRIGIIGPNGAGKTTLVRTLIGERPPSEGTIDHGTGLQIAYFDQTRETLGDDKSLKEILCPDGGDQVMVGDQPRHVASYLGDFLFDPSRLYSPVKSLSGGERNRLLLARLFARPSNLLVLDEPTNDLDLETLELLEEVLSGYAGTLLLVSHDRAFLDRLVTSILSVEGDGVVRETVGGFEDYRRERSARLAEEAEKRRPAGTAPGSGPPREVRPKSTGRTKKLGYKDQRELEQLPDRIEALTADIEKLEAALADADLYARDPKAFGDQTARLQSRQAELEAAEERWLELAELAESLAQG